MRRRSMAVIGWAVFAAAACVFAYAAFQLAGIVTEDARAGRTTSAMRSYTSGPPDEFLERSGLMADMSAEQLLEVTAVEVAGMDEAAAAAAQLSRFEVDFEGLTSKAPDTKAWIRIPGTNISYPVMQGTDNDFYLTHSPDGSENRTGSIFADFRCGEDFADRNTILYGHRMNNNTMFAELHKYEDMDFRATHPYIYINLPDGTVRTYRIFAVYEPDSMLSGHPYQVAWTDDEDFVAWCGAERSRPCYFDSAQTFSASEHILTLSTCVRGEGARRFVVQGRLIAQTEPDSTPGPS